MQSFKISFDGTFTVKAWTEKEAYYNALILLNKLDKKIKDKMNIYINHTITEKEEDEIINEARKKIRSHKSN